jgi:hypothetical protein
MIASSTPRQDESLVSWLVHKEISEVSCLFSRDGNMKASYRPGQLIFLPVIPIAVAEEAQANLGIVTRPLERIKVCITFLPKGKELNVVRVPHLSVILPEILGVFPLFSKSALAQAAAYLAYVIIFAQN